LNLIFASKIDTVWIQLGAYSEKELYARTAEYKLVQNCSI